jgi:hypothetical protein
VTKVYLNRWLLDNLKSKDAQQGDLVALTFNGKKRTASGKEFNAYQLIIEKA